MFVTWLLAGAPALAAAPACSPADLPAVAGRAQALIGTDPEGALRLVQQVDEHCLRSAADVRQLVSLYQLAGAATYYLDQRDPLATARARSWFTRAVVLDPDAALDTTRLGPSPAALYDAVRAELTAAPPGSVLAGERLYLDGELLERGEARRVLPGLHLVQGLQGEPVATVVFDVVGATTVEAMLPGSTRAAAADRGASPWPWVLGGAALTVGGMGLVIVGSGVQDAFDHDVDVACYGFEGSFDDCLAANPDLVALRGRYQGFLVAGWGSVGLGYAAAVRGATLRVSARPGAASVALALRW